jgi:hypothetical protein
VLSLVSPCNHFLVDEPIQIWSVFLSHHRTVVFLRLLFTSRREP